MHTPHLPRLIVMLIVSATAACSSAQRKVPVKEVQVQSAEAVAQSYAIEEPDIGNVEALTAEPLIQGSRLGSGQDILLGEIVNGGQVYLSQFRGKVVLVNYWTSSCAPCSVRLRDMASVSLDYQAFGLVVANVNTGDAPQAARNWLDSSGLGDFSGLQLSDAPGLAANAAGVTRPPTTLLFDREGNEVMRYGDNSTIDRMRQDLDLLLK